MRPDRAFPLPHYLFAGFTLLLIMMQTACSNQSAPPEIEQAARAMHSMMTPANLTRSAFYVAYPEGGPSQYITYLFSPMGTAEWPLSEDNPEGLSAADLRAAGIVPLPTGVAIVARRPQPGRGKQLVLSAADGHGVVVARGYLSATEEPVLVEDWSLKKVETAPGVKAMFLDKLDMGISIK
jgi:hypothetical protein